MTPVAILSIAVVLFFTGLFGVLFRKNFIVILMSLELMLNSSNLALVGSAQIFGAEGIEGHFFVLMVLVLAAVEVAIGLALAVHMARVAEATEVDSLSELHK